MELQSFNEAKSYVQIQAFLIVSELCNTFPYLCGGLQDVEDINENHIATKDDVLLLHVNKLLHCAEKTESQNQVAPKSWSTESRNHRFLNQNISTI